MVVWAVVGLALAIAVSALAIRASFEAVWTRNKLEELTKRFRALENEVRRLRKERKSFLEKGGPFRSPGVTTSEVDLPKSVPRFYKSIERSRDGALTTYHLTEATKRRLTAIGIESLRRWIK